MVARELQGIQVLLHPEDAAVAQIGADVLDEDYFEVRGYNLPGRQLRAGIQIGF
jgi:hypothetical protein